MAARKHDYRTLDLVKAAAFGWAQYRDLNTSEYQILQFVALRGKADEPEVAYAWFPSGGQEWWADVLMMTHPVLRKTLSRLRTKGLLLNLSGSAKDVRFLATRGYAIPMSVMEECRQWHLCRQNLVFSKSQEMHRNVTSGHMDVTSRHTDVTSGHMDVTSGHIGNALTWGFSPHTHVTHPEKNPGETQLLTENSPAANSLSVTRALMINREDDWSAEGPADDFAIPKEAMQKAPGQSTPANRIATVFYDEWKTAREKRPMLAVPWSVKMIFLKNLKGLLEDRSEQFVMDMVHAFFRLVENGQIGLRSDELWRDFWINRAKVERLVLQRTASRTVVNDDEELEKFRKRMGQ